MTGINKYIRISRLPRPALVYAGLSCLTLAAFAAFCIFPGQSRLKHIKNDISALSSDLAFKDQILPAYAKALHLSEKSFAPSLPLPDREPLQRNQLPGFLNRFRLIVSNHSLHLSQNRLNMPLLNDKSDAVSISLHVEGRMKDFRAFIISLISLPYFSGFEEISISPMTGDVKTMLINFRINIRT